MYVRACMHACMHACGRSKHTYSRCTSKININQHVWRCAVSYRRIYPSVVGCLPPLYDYTGAIVKVLLTGRWDVGSLALMSRSHKTATVMVSPSTGNYATLQRVPPVFPPPQIIAQSDTRTFKPCAVIRSRASRANNDEKTFKVFLLYLQPVEKKFNLN